VIDKCDMLKNCSDECVAVLWKESLDDYKRHKDRFDKIDVELARRYRVRDKTKEEVVK